MIHPQGVEEQEEGIHRAMLPTVRSSRRPKEELVHRQNRERKLSDMKNGAGEGRNTKMSHWEEKVWEKKAGELGGN